eukprot:jgi/Mesvir1/962/Mv17515-RA.1
MACHVTAIESLALQPLLRPYRSRRLKSAHNHKQQLKTVSFAVSFEVRNKKASRRPTAIQAADFRMPAPITLSEETAAVQPVPLTGGDVDVAIIGGGPGGLAAAHAVKKAGLSVRVFESAAEYTTRGGALPMYPNGLAALEGIKKSFSGLAISLGSESQTAQLLSADGAEQYAGPFLLSAHFVAYGKPFVWLAWSALCDMLRKELSDDELSSGHTFSRFEPCEGGVRLFFEGKTGSIKAKALVGADGSLSVVAKQLLGKEGRPDYKGVMTWTGQFTVPLPTPPAQGEAPTPPLAKPNEVVMVNAGDQNFALQWAGRRVACWTATAPLREDDISPLQEGARSRVLDRFKGWPDAVLQAIRATPSEAVREAGVYDRPPLASWGEGPVTLLGDAAHPMRPTLGQATCMALEDAHVLGEKLAEGAKSGDLESALRGYEEERSKRTKVVQVRSRSEAERAYRETPEELYEAKVEAEDVPVTDEEFEKWLYSYNMDFVPDEDPAAEAEADAAV